MMNMQHFKCDICEKAFKTKATLKQHFNNYHNASGKVYQCNVCTKSFQAQRNLAVHIKNLHKEQWGR